MTARKVWILSWLATLAIFAGLALVPALGLLIFVTAIAGA